MANFKALKKIAALVTAIALVVCFAVSASAVEVVTTTSYVEGNNSLVNVHVAVTGLDDADAFVTYYATDASSNPVHIDQVAAASNAADFNFQTEATKLESSVVIGRTSADAAITGETIDGLAITWSINGGATTTEVIATEAGSYTIAYTATSGMDFDYATVNGERAEADEAAGNIVVSLASLADEAREATIVIYEKEIEVPVGDPSIIANAITAAAVEVEDGSYEIYDENGNAITPDDEAISAEAGNRKLTVIGNAAGAEEFGIIVSYEAITVDKAASLDGYEAYKALAATEAGTFAIQLIDSATEAHEVIPDAGVYVAVYAFDGNVYSITAIEDAVTVE